MRRFDRFSVAMTDVLHGELRHFLSREDLQEDLCFALYRPSLGATRFTALLVTPVLPGHGDRSVHGNVGFLPTYFERTVSEAVEAKTGIAFLHSHPLADKWQGMSHDDFTAESEMAAAIQSATGLPLIGLTLSCKSGFWSGRSWLRDAGRWIPNNCENVRVLGRRCRWDFCPSVKHIPNFPETLDRTVSAWGSRVQSQLASLRVGIIGLGSVGALVAESLARVGFGELLLIDPDRVESVNLDRTLNAYPEHAASAARKVQVAACSAARGATFPGFRIESLSTGIQDPRAYGAALDCDVLFSCVDRPWPRYILNQIAYAHFIPVIDGGIDVSRNTGGELRSADWGVFVVSPGRRCLECWGQYKQELVPVERAGNLDDPRYIETLPKRAL